jgi:hypothetical protein
VRVNWKNAFAIRSEVPPQDERFMNDWASAILRRRLGPPAIVMLEMAKPFSWLLMNITTGAQPLLTPFFGSERLDRVSRLFNTRQNLEHLIQLLEEGNEPSGKE